VETAILQKNPATFIIGIGWTLKDGYPHEMRAADYDDWVTDTQPETGRPTHGLNGDILVWNSMTRRRHELSSMGIRVDRVGLRRQLELTAQLEFPDYPYRQAILNGEIPLSIGGGIGQSLHADAFAAQGAPGRGQRRRLAQSGSNRCAARNINVLE
jgi:aspartate--ammonia ligase